jgi:hypothetical protein
MEIDMSPEAVTMRLKRVSQLRNVCLALNKRGNRDYEKYGKIAEERFLANGGSLDESGGFSDKAAE